MHYDLVTSYAAFIEIRGAHAPSALHLPTPPPPPHVLMLIS